MTEPCERRRNILGRCKYEPRFDEVSATEPNIMLWATRFGAVPKPTPARKTYLFDICIRCGRMANRRKPATSAKPAQP